MDSRIEERATKPSVVSPISDYWQELGQAGAEERLCRAWLSILCTLVQGAQSGLLVIRAEGGSYVPVALWPREFDPGNFTDLVHEVLNKRQVATHVNRSGETRIAYPIVTGTELCGVVALEIRGGDALDIARSMHLIHWGMGWLADLFNRRQFSEKDARLERSAYLFDLSLAALAEEDFSKAALAVVNRLARRFHCHQVLLGLEKGKNVRVAAMSHSAWFDEKSNLLNLAALAMNESFDQRSCIVIPEPQEGASHITAAHRRYVEESGSSALCSLPMEVGNKILGVWLLERDDPFTAQELEILDTLTLTLSPILELKLNAEENLFKHTQRSWQSMVRGVTDTSRPGVKLLALVIVLVLSVMAFYQTGYRVASEAKVEGSVQRVAVAPFQGYIREALARAGDVVKQGQVLAVLEDKDLKLERARWEAELELAQRKEREAMANADRVALRLASAQANQANAQLNLALEKLNRVQVTAGFDGVVVRGDLSQKLGSPVDQGDVLFELAPLDSWRVILKVDEQDIANVHEGHAGELVLTSLPGQSFPFTVKKVTPVSVAEEGHNYFRVEAEVGRGVYQLRPGMEGIGKVEAGDESLLWIWTHHLTNWMRLSLWKWMP